jgi:hypothetical protein
MRFYWLTETADWLSSNGRTLGRYVTQLPGALAYVLINSIFWIVIAGMVVGLVSLLGLDRTGFLSPRAKERLGGVKNGQEEK